MNTKPLFADTKPTKKYLVDGITKDITIEDSIFDLIDNSIDAFPENKNGSLPEDYNNYKIELTLNSDIFSITDHGTGMNSQTLQNNALRFGSHPKHHDTSIGHFGIGLNRALFKLGKIATIKTCTVKENIQLTFDSNKFLGDDNYWDLPLTINKTNNKDQTGTSISIENLNKEVAEKFSSSEWLKSFIISISQRYALFLVKNLVISINKKNITTIPVKISDASGFKKLENSFKHNSIDINIQLGQHLDFLFPYEQTEDKKNSITRKECGWFVYCNGRAIKLFDWSTDTGWFTKPHSEHTGFIGLVEFIGHPSKLPWNTSKSNIDLNNETYKKALLIMKDFSEKWRTHTGKVKRGQLFYPSSEIPVNTNNPTQEETIDAQHPTQEETIDAQHPTQEGTIDSQHPTQEETIDAQHPAQEGTIDAQHPTQEETIDAQHPAQEGTIDAQHPTQEETIDAQHPTQEESTKVFEYDPNFTPPQHALENDYLFGSSKAKVPFNIPEHEYKIRSVLNELVKIKIEAKNGFPLASLMLIRCFIELGCIYYTNKKDIKIKKGSLGEQVKYCLDKMTELKFKQNLDSRRIGIMYSLCNENKSEKNVLCIQNLQITIHSDDLIWDKSNILAFWYGILPFLIECYN